MTTELKSPQLEKEVRVLPPVMATWYRYLSINIWGNMPSSIQRKISNLYAHVYNHPLSKLLIKPYCRFHYKDPNYLQQFTPPNGKDQYTCFQDFFVRQFKELPKRTSEKVWPCEGTICHVGYVNHIPTSNIKGDIKTLPTIFGVSEEELPDTHYFTNVFLHNKNYHRIHAPVSGKVRRIQKIDGDLVLLRPWVYPQNPSIPAFRNERVNIDIEDKNGDIWYLSIVGGPAVGTIELASGIELGTDVDVLQEIATFYLGSTCCIAAPKPPTFHKKNHLVYLGDYYS